MHILPIIPARFDSERFPGKLLEMYRDRSVISWPIRCCIEAFGQCLIATDSKDIADECAGKCDILLSKPKDYRNGTERIADACNRLNVSDETLIVHVQGDEVGLNPENLKRLAQTAIHDRIATLFYRTDDEKILKSRDHVKCWRWDIGRDPPSFNFSRAYENDGARWNIHVGVYCYRRDMLRNYMSCWPTDEEKRERLEQLRWDVPIEAYEVAPCKSINVPEDLE